MAEKITKTEAVRRALAVLGNDAMPVAIQGWVKEKLGVEMTAGHVSTTKGELLRKGKKKAGKKATVKLAAPESGAEPSVEVTPAKTVPATTNGKGIDLADLQTLLYTNQASE